MLFRSFAGTPLLGALLPMFWWSLSTKIGMTLVLLIPSDSDAMPYGSCGTKTPSRTQQLVDQARILGFKQRAAGRSADGSGRKLLGETCEELTEICNQCVEIPIYFHFLAIEDFDLGFVLPHPTEAFKQYFEEGDGSALDDLTTLEMMVFMAQENVDLVNRVFEGTPFRFTFADFTVSTDLAWAKAPLENVAAMVEALGRGGLETLNVYASYQLTDADETTTLGQATFPSNQGRNPDEGDGVWIIYSTLTGGGTPNNDLGFTLAHEIGHWMGLYHTFQTSIFAPLEGEDVSDPCSDSNTNDFVDDTGVHTAGQDEDFNCTDFLFADEVLEVPDTCPGQELRDPFFNIMNYLSDEICFEAFGEFTCGQIERMWLQWNLYRDVADTCNDDEMLVDIVVRFEQGEFSLNNTFYLSTTDGWNRTEFDGNSTEYRNSTDEERIFDSATDVDPCNAYFSLQDEIAVDLCVPRDQNYEFVFLDSFGDGTLTSPFLIVVDGGTFECEAPAAFGTEVRVLFNADSMECNGEVLVREEE